MFSVDSIFFDIDGTLVDATLDITSAVNYVMRSLGARALDRDYIMSYVGNGVKDLLRSCLDTKDESLVLRASEMYRERFMAHAADQTRLYPHAREVLEYFKGKRLFVLTNRYRDFAEATLKGLGIAGYFEDVVGGDDESCLKPSACVLDRIRSASGIDRSRSLIVGDMAVDVMTGKNAGIKTCWVTHGLGKIEDIKALKPDYIIEDLIELKEIVK